MLGVIQQKRMIVELHSIRFTLTRKTRLNIALAARISTFGNLIFSLQGS